MPHTQHDPSAARLGIIATAGAFFIWGLLPLYLKPLNSIGALQIAAWRNSMGMLTIVGWMTWHGKLREIIEVAAQPKLIGRLALSGGLLAFNWSLYAWGVTHGEVLATSLGYFINPLVNVLLAVLVLSERLNRLQWLAVGIAATGVAGLAIYTGQIPWIALLLAISFGTYGLLRRTAKLAPMTGLAWETLLYAPLGCGFLLYSAQHDMTIWSNSSLVQTLLLLSGVVTIVPLSLFNFGARRIKYTTVGMLQYIGPTMQFLIGCFIYKESLSSQKLTCYVLIWMALAIYAGDSLLRSRLRTAN